MKTRDTAVPHNGPIGQRFADRFDIVGTIGEGAMGRVYRARDDETGEWVALKLLQPEHVANDELIGRFNREMRATAQIDHPNTTRVVDYGEFDGVLYLAMELIEGTPLDELIVDEAPMSEARTVRLGSQIACALAAAHAQSFIHRDLKPENILVTDGDRVKVLDFGLAAVLDRADATRLTSNGLRVGTPLFMAPEYIEGKPADHRVDLYALGVVLYMLVAGRAPFLGSGYTLLHRAVTEEPPPPSELAPGCPSWLDAIILRLMDKDPDKRLQSAEEVLSLLQLGVTAHAPSQPPFHMTESMVRELGLELPPPPKKGPSPLRLLIVATLGLGMGLSLGAALLALWWWS